MSPLQVLEQLLEPGASPTAAQRDIDLYRSFVEDSLKAGESQAAQHLLERICSAHPNLREAWYGLGYLALRTGQAPLMERAARTALRISPGWAIGHNLLGVALLESKRPEAARAELLLAIKAEPTLFFPWLNLYRLARPSGDYAPLFGLAKRVKKNLAEQQRADLLETFRRVNNAILNMSEDKADAAASARFAASLASLTNDRGHEARCLAELAMRQHAANEQAEAEVSLRKSVLSVAGAPIAQRAFGLGSAAEASLALGKPAQASKLAAQATALSIKVGRSDWTWRILAVRCKALTALGEHPSAGECYIEAATRAAAEGAVASAYVYLRTACSPPAIEAEARCDCLEKVATSLTTSEPVVRCIALDATADCKTLHRPPAATAAYRSALDACKQVPEAHRGLAVLEAIAKAHSALGQASQAIALRHRIIDEAARRGQRFTYNYQRTLLVEDLGKAGRLEEALKLAEKLVVAIEKQNGPVEGIRPDIVLNNLLRLEDPASMLPVYDLWVRTERAMGRTLELASVLLTRSDRRRFLGDSAGAKADLQEAENLLERSRDHPDRHHYTELRCRLAIVQARAEAAIRECSRLVELAKTNSNPRIRASALSRLSESMDLAGNRKASAELIEREAAIWEKAGHLSIAYSCWWRLALRYMRDDRPDQVRRVLKEASRTAKTVLQRIQVDRLLVEVDLLEGRYDEAYTRLEHALSEAGDDERAWQCLLMCAAIGVVESKMRQQILSAAQRWLRGRTKPTSVVTRGYILGAEARVSGDTELGARRLVKIIEEAETRGRVPTSLLQVGCALALESSNLELADRFRRSVCQRSPGPDCEQHGSSPSSIVDAKILRYMPIQGSIVDEAQRQEMDREANELLAAPLPPIQRYADVASMLVWTNPARAIKLARQAQALLTSKAEPATRLAVLLALAEALSHTGQRESGRRRFLEAARLVQRHFDGAQRRRWLLDVARRFAAAGFCNESRDLRERLLATVPKDPNNTLLKVLRLSSAVCDFNVETPTAAKAIIPRISVLEELARDHISVGERVPAFLVFTMMARIYWLTGHTSEAIDRLVSAVEQLREALACTADTALHSRILAGVGRFAYDGAIQMMATRDAPGDNRESLALAEESRAWTLLKRLGARGLSRAADTLPASVKEEEKRLGTQVSLAERRQNQVMRTKPWDEEAIAAKRSELAAARAALHDFAEQLWQQHPVYASVRFPRRLDLTRLPLRRDELLVEYRELPDGVVLWVVDRLDEKSTPVVRKMAVAYSSAADFRNHVATWLDWLQNTLRLRYPDAHPRPQSGAILSRNLLAPVLQVLDHNRHRRLLVVPDGALHRLPLEALELGPLGGCKRPDGGHSNTLADCVQVGYLPSISIMTVQRSLPRRGTAERTLLAVGDPVFDTNDSRLRQQAVVSRSLTTECQKLPRLPATTDEIEAARNLLCGGNKSSGCIHLLGPAASEAAWRQSIQSRYLILHFATHTATIDENGVCKMTNAEDGEPALVLALPVMGKGDNLLSRSEVMGLDLAHTRLVVLSACASASGVLMRGEGLAGLAEAFLHAGSEEVVASHWPVSDEATAVLMKAFYSAYAESSDAAVALQRARAVLRSAPSTSDPFFWAAFTLYSTATEGH